MRNFQISLIVSLIGIFLLFSFNLNMDNKDIYDDLQLMQLNRLEYTLIIQYRDNENNKIKEDYKEVKKSKDIYDVKFYDDYLPTKIGDYQLENYDDQILNKAEGVRLVTLYYIEK